MSEATTSPTPPPPPPGPSPSPPGHSPPSPPPHDPDFDNEGNKIVIGKVHCSLCMSIGREPLHAIGCRFESFGYVKPASGVEGNRL